MGSLNAFLDSVKWDDSGLIACVAQDAKDGAVLMVAYMNRDSLKKTIEEGRLCYWSRSRKKFWLKGEESGNFQVLKELYVDCDADCLVAKIDQIGDAACHTGMRSCFYRQVGRDGSLKETGKRVFDPSKIYKK